MFVENYTQLISLDHCNKEEHLISSDRDAGSLFTRETEEQTRQMKPDSAVEHHTPAWLLCVQDFVSFPVTVISNNSARLLWGGGRQREASPGAALMFLSNWWLALRGAVNSTNHKELNFLRS